MKWALRGLAAVAVLLLVAVGVLAFALPRLAKSDAARARIQEATRSVLGLELGYADLDFGLLPPSLVVVDPALLSDAESDPVARAERVALRVQLLPLLRRQLEVQSLSVDGLALNLVRDADGFALPGMAKRETPAEPSEPSDGSPAPAESAGIVLGIRTISLRDASFTIEDRTVSPATKSRLDDVDVSFRSSGSGGERRVTGTLSVPDADLALDGFAVRGPFEAEIASDDMLAGTGEFELDASAAALRYGADFTKPAGVEATVRGLLVTDADGALGADDLEIVVKNLVATGSLRTGADTQLTLSAAPFAIDGWEALVPALGLVTPTGRVGISELVVKPSLASTRGRFQIDPIDMTLPDSGPLSFTGEVVLAGASLFSRDAQLLLAGEPFTVSPKLDDLAGAPRFEVRFETAGASSDALLDAFAGLPDRLHGPLVASGTLRGPVGGEKPFLDTLVGDIDFGIENGRIVGASLLEAALGSLGKRVAESRRAQGDAAWERFYTEQFEKLAGKVRLERSHLISQPVTLAYRDYGVTLEGPVRLPDFALDLRGVLLLGTEVDRELARAFDAPDDYVPSQREVVLQSVRGFPTEPKVQLASNSVASLAAHYVKATQREELKRRAEKELGSGSGEIIDRGLDALEGILGGRR